MISVGKRNIYLETCLPSLPLFLPSPFFSLSLAQNLTMQTRLDSNSRGVSCLCLLCALPHSDHLDLFALFGGGISLCRPCQAGTHGCPPVSATKRWDDWRCPQARIFTHFRAVSLFPEHVEGSDGLFSLLTWKVVSSRSCLPRDQGGNCGE